MDKKPEIKNKKCRLVSEKAYRSHGRVDWDYDMVEVLLEISLRRWRRCKQKILIECLSGIDYLELIEKHVSEYTWVNDEIYLTFWVDDERKPQDLIQRIVTGHNLKDCIEEMMCYNPVNLDDLEILV